MILRALIAVVIVAGAVFTGPVASSAQEDISVTGEILDMTCYLHKGSKGRRHRACAEMCAEKGLPIGILTDKDEVYLLIEDHDNPAPYAAAVKLAGDKAAIVGKLYSKGNVTGIMVLGATEK